jgi:hypothetical protein
MKLNYYLTLFFMVLFGGQSFGQTNNDAFIKGTLDIRYNTRNQMGPADVYTLNYNVCNSAVFRGTIAAKPFVKGALSDTMGLLEYNIDCDVLNPRNPTQSKNIGRLYGTAPVNGQNIYQFGNGNVKVSVFSAGSARGFDSKFTGNAAGKPPTDSGMFSRMKREALNLTKSVNGKTVGITVSKYDKMDFANHGLAAGPVQTYPEAIVNGTLIYDYARTAWYLQNIVVVYVVDGQNKADKLAGTIRWVEAPNRKTSGMGEYQFDIRVNEPPPNESSVFASAQDESSFFDTDTTVPSLTGTMKYKDTLVGETVTASHVDINLIGNKLTKQQAMYLSKLLLLSSTVPLNAE